MRGRYNLWSSSFRPCVASPNVFQWTVAAINRVLVRSWQRGNIFIRSWPFAGQTSQQISFAAVGVSSYDTKIVAGPKVLMRDAGRDNYHIASLHVDVLAILSAGSQLCSTRINAQHFMRCAVIMSEGIDSIAPRIGPVILGKAFFENRRRIFRVRSKRLSIKQQGKGIIWEDTVVFEIQLV